MPLQKLVIEYVSDKPIFPPDHFKMETAKHCYLGWKYLFDFLDIFSERVLSRLFIPQREL